VEFPNHAVLIWRQETFPPSGQEEQNIFALMLVGLACSKSALEDFYPPSLTGGVDDGDLFELLGHDGDPRCGGASRDREGGRHEPKMSGPHVSRRGREFHGCGRPAVRKVAGVAVGFSIQGCWILEARGRTQGQNGWCGMRMWMDTLGWVESSGAG
jgi:hypothetical protein